MSGNLVFDVENFRGTSVGDAARVFFDWASGRDERKQGLWGKPLNRITVSYTHLTLPTIPGV